MQVTSFHGPNSTWAFTPDETGSNLPVELGPWQKFKIINMHRGQPARIAVNADAALDAIEQDGFYITSASIKIGGDSDA
jgi:hypothetical protein